MFENNKVLYIIAAVVGGLLIFIVVALAALLVRTTDERNDAVVKMNEYAYKVFEFSQQLQETKIQLSSAKDTIATLTQQVQQIKSEPAGQVKTESTPNENAKAVTAPALEQQTQPVGSRCPGGIDKSPKVSADREKFIKKLIANGIFKSHRLSKTVSDMAVVTVTPLFMSLDFDDKRGFVSVIYAHYFDGCDKNANVSLRDSITNKTVGSYSIEWSLQLD